MDTTSTGHESRPPRSRLHIAGKAVRRSVRIAHNILGDLRFGALLGGIVRTRYADRGAKDVVNSDYEALRRIFNGRITPTDVLVDVGCGKGRVINWWLSQRYRNQIYGLELDPDVATNTRQRLQRFPNVTIVTGDAVSSIPADATVIYLFNPFTAPVVQALSEALLRCERLRAVLYYCPVHVDVFLEDPRWCVEQVAIGDDSFHRLAIIRPALPAHDVAIVSGVKDAGRRVGAANSILKSFTRFCTRLRRSGVFRTAAYIGGTVALEKLGLRIQHLFEATDETFTMADSASNGPSIIREFTDLRAADVAALRAYGGDRVLALFRKALAAGDVCVVTRVDGALANVCWVCIDSVPGGKQPYIRRCFTTPAYRGCGLYPRGLRHAAWVAHQEGGVGPARLRCSVFNHSSLAGIRKAGFDHVGTDLLIWRRRLHIPSRHRARSVTVNDGMSRDLLHASDEYICD